MALIVDTLSLTGILAEPNTGSLGIGKNGGRDMRTICTYKRRGSHGYGINSLTSLPLGGMSQHTETIHITNCIDTFYGSFKTEYRCNFDTQTLIIFKAGILKIITHTRLSAHRHQHTVGFHLFYLAFLILEANHLSQIMLFNLLHSALHVEDNATLFKYFTQSLGNIAIECGQTFFHELHHGNINPER